MLVLSGVESKVGAGPVLTSRELSMRCGVQKVQDVMLVAVQMVQGRCRGGAGCLHHLHRHEHYVRCREVQEVQGHLSRQFVVRSSQKALVIDLARVLYEKFSPWPWVNSRMNQG